MISLGYFRTVAACWWTVLGGQQYRTVAGCGQIKTVVDGGQFRTVADGGRLGLWLVADCGWSRTGTVAVSGPLGSNKGRSGG